MKNKLFALVCALLMLFAANALAESVDLNRSVSLEMVFQDEGGGVADVQFGVHRVAALDADGKLKLVAPFDRYKVNLSVQSESDMAGTAHTLEGYVLRDGIAPMSSCKTDANGKAAFSGDGMKPGLYLVPGGRFVIGGKVYTVQPTVVQLPLRASEDAKWDYDVAVSVKYVAQPDSTDETRISRKVLKVWKGEGYENALPEEITVQLLQDGKVFDTVTLNADMLWRHTWEDLDAKHHWTVVEKELDDFSVNVTREGITFVVTNTYDPDESEEPTPTPTPAPTNPPSSSGGGSGSKLPQTGQLWWPIPMLLSAGLLLIVIGLLRRRGN